MKEIVNLFNGFSTAMKIVLIVIGVLILAGCLFVIICYAKGIFFVGVKLSDKDQANFHHAELFGSSQKKTAAKEKKNNVFKAFRHYDANLMPKSLLVRFLVSLSVLNKDDATWGDVGRMVLLRALVMLPIAFGLSFFTSMSFEGLIFISAMYFGIFSPMMHIIPFFYRLHKFDRLASLFPEEYSQYIEDRNAYINILNEERTKSKVSRYSTKHENVF